MTPENNPQPLTEQELAEIEEHISAATSGPTIPAGCVPADGLLIAQAMETAQRRLAKVAPRLLATIRHLQGENARLRERAPSGDAVVIPLDLARYLWRILDRKVYDWAQDIKKGYFMPHQEQYKQRDERWLEIVTKALEPFPVDHPKD